MTQEIILSQKILNIFSMNSYIFSCPFFGVYKGLNKGEKVILGEYVTADNLFLQVNPRWQYYLFFFPTWFGEITFEDKQNSFRYFNKDLT